LKALKNLGFVLLLVVLSLALVGLFLPGNVNVERRLTIAASAETLFPLLDSPQAFTRWSPWSTPGSEIRYAFEGPVSGVGASLHWEGGAFPMASGDFTITEVEPQRRVALRMHLPLLGKTHSTFELYPGPDAGSTLVAWRFQDDVGFNLLRRFLWLVVESTLGPQFERGLTNLQGLAERR
jgi:uncharacterized protein YndB with AHSA1/START domain